MLINLSKLLNIKKEENTRIILLIIQSLFYGIFISYYTSYINALFLSVFDISYLSCGYLGSGIIGIISAYIFSFSLKKLSFKVLSTATLLVIFLFILILKLGINYNYSKEILAFIGFIFYTPITSLIALIFSSLTMKLFDLRQGKRLFGLIATGSVIAAIISYLTVPLLIVILNDSSDLLWCSLIGVFISGIIQIIINNKYSNYIIESKKTLKLDDNVQEVSILKNSYFRSIYIVSILSMVGVILVSYSFFSASKIFFNDFDIKTLGQFFGLFFGITKSIEFIMNTFISGKLLEKNGLKFGLSSLPISLLILSTLALALSLISIQFKNLEAIVFIVVVLSMLLFIVVKRSFEDSSFKLLFQPININIKSIVQSSTEGKARQLGSILAGLSLVVLQFSIDSEYLQITCISLIVFNCIFWVISVKKVSFEYKNYISNELNNIKKSTPESLKVKNFTSALFQSKDYEVKPITKYMIPGIEYLKHSEKVIKNPLDGCNLSPESQNKIEYINFITDNWSNSYFGEVLYILEDKDSIVVSYLIYMLKVRIASIDFKTFVYSQKLEFSNRLLTLLIFIDYDFANSKKLIEANLSANHNSSLMLIDILSEANWDESGKILLRNLNVKNIEAESKIISALNHKKIKSTSENNGLIINKIQDEVSRYNWIITSLLDLTEDSLYSELCTLLELELDYAVLRIFKLTSLIYNEDEISKIINIIQDKNSDQNILAIELVDILIEVELKEYLIPVIDNLSYDEKNLKLNSFFPQKRMEPLDRLKNILNSEYFKINIWIRLKTMELLTSSSDILPNEIISNIFNADLALREGAFYCLYKFSKDKFLFYIRNDSSKIKEMYLNPEQAIYRSNYLNVFERFNSLKKSIFLKTIKDIEIIKILKVTDSKVYTKNDLNYLHGTEFAFLIIDGFNTINKNSEIEISEIEDLIILKSDSFTIFKDLYSDNIRMLKIDFIELIKIIATSESLFSKFT